MAQGIDVTYGYEIEDIQYGDGGAVTAAFKNGKKVAGTILVGADGPRSKVRQLLLGDKGDVTPLDVVHANVALCYDDSEKARFIRKAHPVFSVSVHPEVFSFISSKSMFPSLSRLDFWNWN